MSDSGLRAHALRIFRASLKAADPGEAIRRYVRIDGASLVAGRRRYSLASFDRIFVIGAGKAGSAMGLAVERLLGKRIAGGFINVKDGHTARLRRIRLNECGHPVPDERGVRGSEEIAAIARSAGERDLVLCLISGGASALMPYPAGEVTLSDKQETTRLLLACGATIHEINAVRKHISAIKGGQLAALTWPAHVVALILSDVIGDDLDVIGSGMTAPDSSTFERAFAVLSRYGLERRVPTSVLKRLKEGAAGRIAETPKPGDRVFERTQNLIVGGNRLALDAAAAEARRLGYRPLILSSTIDGETREIARMHAAIAREVRATGHPARPPVCLISGGETTVTLRGKGKGGRNQEFTLAAAIALAGTPGVCILSAGTDGTDGPTDAAGAIAFGSTGSHPEAVVRLDDNDAYNLFERPGGLIKTGPTGTNVMDVRLILVR
jgi:hydroxypyruvate reductase